MLVIDSVDKLYPGGVKALCSFSIDQGPGILGLLGPNGAGKSTLMRILSTVTRPTGAGARCGGLGSDLAGERVVILSTHIVSDVEAVATEIAIIDRGLLVAHGAP